MDISKAKKIIDFNREQKEKIGKKKACALALIIAGIVIYALGTPQ